MPFRKSKPWDKTKPPVGFGIDWGDPINNALAHDWIFNEGAGTLGVNIVNPNANAVFGANNGWGPTNSGSGVVCSGLGSTMNVGNSSGSGAPNSTLGTWTLAASVYLVSTTNNGCIYGGASNNAIQLRANTRVDLVKQGVAIIGQSAVASLALNTWYQIVASFNDITNDWAIYINGILNASGNTATTLTYAMQYSLCQSGNGDKLRDGSKLDWFKIWNRILLPSEVRRLYTEPFAGRLTPRRRISSFNGTTTPIVPVVDTAAVGNLDWLKVKGPRRPVRIKRSEFATVEEYRDTISKAAAALAVASVPVAAISPQTSEVIGDDILEDDEILLLALTRILH